MNHYVNGHSFAAPFPAHLSQAIFGLGCFWGAERIFWQAKGVYVTAVGYTAGVTENPSYEQVCTGRTGHNEAVLVVFDPLIISYEALLKLFFESHDPTQGDRQGNDRGTQYRSGIYVFDENQAKSAHMARDSYQIELKKMKYPAITTEIAAVGAFYYAEGYHQQYLAKNPNGYCGIGGTGIECALVRG
jgi:peptide-methionine (S)-S-oxide reductase